MSNSNVKTNAETVVRPSFNSFPEFLCKGFKSFVLLQLKTAGFHTFANRRLCYPAFAVPVGYTRILVVYHDVRYLFPKVFSIRTTTCAIRQNERNLISFQANAVSHIWQFHCITFGCSL